MEGLCVVLIQVKRNIVMSQAWGCGLFVQWGRIGVFAVHPMPFGVMVEKREGWRWPKVRFVRHRRWAQALRAECRREV